VQLLGFQHRGRALRLRQGAHQLGHVACDQLLALSLVQKRTEKAAAVVDPAGCQAGLRHGTPDGPMVGQGARLYVVFQAPEPFVRVPAQCLLATSGGGESAGLVAGLKLDQLGLDLSDSAAVNRPADLLALALDHLPAGGDATLIKAVLSLRDAAGAVGSFSLTLLTPVNAETR
jgi:hypothetical protein